MKLSAACLAVLCSALATLAQAAEQKPHFDGAAIARISSLGPWPPKASADLSNRFSGKAPAIFLGEKLFFDKRLSRDGSVACASCHHLSMGFSDGLPLGVGIARGERNTLGLHNLRWQRWFGWSGANDNLWAQSLRPLVLDHEMGGSLSSVANALRQNADLGQAYRRVTGKMPEADDELVAVNVAKLLAAFQETLVTPRTPFDDFRDALVRGKAAGGLPYPAAAQRGLAIFVGKGNCIFCHSGAQFSNGEFHDIGIGYFVAPGIVDKGRFEGIGAVLQSRYNLLGPFNDDIQRSTATSTRYVARTHRNFGEFKVPSLRNVANTAPYMHNGSLASLRDVIGHYSEINEERLHADGERILVPLHLSAQEVDDLLAFLQSLSTPSRAKP